MDLYIADIDGVVVALDGTPHAGAISRLCGIALKNWLGLVTGREAAYLQERFLPVVEQEVIKQPTLAKHLLVGVEYAGMLLSYTETGWSEQRSTSHSSTATSRLRTSVQHIAAKYPLLMFHERKQVVLTVGIPSKKIPADQLMLANDQLELALADIQSLAQNIVGVEVHRTTKAIDVVPAGMSKAFGAEIMLTRCGFVPQFVHLFGDAPADLALAEPFIARKIPYRFWYVGRQADVTTGDRQKFDLRFPSGDSMYQEGMFEVLQQFYAGD